MKFISWNVNGIRAWYKKGMFDWVLKQDADIFCFQETKAHREQLDGEIVYPKGYFSYFDHSKIKKGYSGVAVYSKKEPLSIDYSLNEEKSEHLDQEGRFLALHFKEFSFINCYFPNGGNGIERLKFKLEFYEAFLKYIENLKKTQKNIIFCGDVNTAHNEIDLSRPKENQKTSGFMRIERDWLDKITQLGWIDTFRYKNPETIKYSWWDMKTFARERNIGWRIDYFFVSNDLVEKIKKADILNDIYGSDHCPILLEIK